LDIHLSDVRPADEEKAAVDSVLGPPASRWEGGERTGGVDTHVAMGGHAVRERRHLLLPTLHAINDRVGWISEGALNYACERLTIPPAEAFGVASFYHMFSMKPRPKTVVYVCDDIACMCAGGDELCAELEASVAREGEPYADGSAAWVRSPCLGMCNTAPAALVVQAGAPPRGGFQVPLRSVTVEHVRQRARREVASVPLEGTRVSSSQDSVLFRKSPFHRASAPAQSEIEEFIAIGERGGKRDALRRAFELGREGVIREVSDSKLMGRGGAAFPTGRKWDAVARAPERPHYIVCNADESEPGTFKDLHLIEDNAFELIEAMTIAAFASSCEKGYIYVRGEYSAQASNLERALERSRRDGYIGNNILGSGFDIDIEVRRGAGAYICGEETALFNSIEGYRGEPRNKPPFPVQKGLFGKPTIVNNVETLANIPYIVRSGGSAFAAIGTSESAGTRLFCLSGHVKNPGLYEVPFGTTLRSLIDKAGGVAGGKKLQAVLLGGAAGTFLTPDELDVQLSFEGVRAIKASLGSGVVMLFDETVDLRKIVARIARFFRDESCGQCVPCRVGTVRQEELLERFARGTANGSPTTERVLLGEIGQAMRDASICGLGQTASSAIESALSKFDLYGGTTPA
jgi:NADH-quinone oxidoreductase subunit F